MQMQKSKFDGKQHNLAQNMKKYISAELQNLYFAALHQEGSTVNKATPSCLYLFT